MFQSPVVHDKGRTTRDAAILQNGDCDPHRARFSDTTETNEDGQRILTKFPRRTESFDPVQTSKTSGPSAKKFFTEARRTAPACVVQKDVASTMPGS
jgi:hypothetical protein